MAGATEWNEKVGATEMGRLVQWNGWEGWCNENHVMGWTASTMEWDGWCNGMGWEGWCNEMGWIASTTRLGRCCNNG